MAAEKEGAIVPDEYGREPFQHPALAQVDNLNVEMPVKVVNKEKIEQLAFDAGIDKVLRWKPAKVSADLTNRLMRHAPSQGRKQTHVHVHVWLTQKRSSA